MKKRIICMLICTCMAIGLLTQTSLMSNRNIVANAAETATVTEFVDGREVIRITNDDPKDNPYGVGRPIYSSYSLSLFLNILRNNPDAYIILETDIVIRNEATIVNRIMKHTSSIEKKWDNVNYYLYPEVGTFNGVLDGNGHSIKNLQLSVNNNGTPIPASNNIGMIHTLGENGVIKNLTLDAPEISQEVRMSGTIGVGGFLVYDNKGVIENCTIKSAYINLCSDTLMQSAEIYYTGGADNFGGFTAVNNGTIRDCNVEGMDIVLPDWSVKNGSTDQPKGFGGIANTNNGTIENCILNNLFVYSKINRHERGANFTDFGGAVGVNTGTVSNVHVGYQIIKSSGRFVGDPGSHFYVTPEETEAGIQKWFTSDGTATAFGRVIGSNSGTYSGLTSILNNESGDVYTAPAEQPLRNRMIGNDNGSTTGNSATAQYDISVTFSQADVIRNGDACDAEFSVLSSENATVYYLLSDTEVADVSVLEASGDSAALTADASSTFALTGLDIGKTYTYYVAAKKADDTWSDIKSFSVITPKKSPELTLKNPSESIDRTYTGSAVDFTQGLFSWKGDGELTLSYSYCYGSGIIKTTPENSGAASDGAPPVKTLTNAAYTYYIKATLTASGEYEPASITISFKINQADTQFDGGIQVYVNDVIQTEAYSLTYGDKLTVKVKPAIAGTTDSTIKATGNMALHSGGTQLSDTISAPDENGYYTMVYNTSDKKVLIGDSALTVKYSGNNEMKAINENFNIALNKRVISFTSTDPILNREYTGEAIFTGELYDKYSPLNLPNLLGTDAKTVNISGTVTSPSANAGEYHSDFTFENPHLIAGKDGDSTAYYSLDTESVNNGYILIHRKSTSVQGLNFNINVIEGEGNFDEPELASIHEKGTFTYKYNGNLITYQEIINMLKTAALGSTLTFDYDSALNNQSSNYTGHYYGKMNFTVTSMLFNGVNDALGVNLSNKTYGVTLGDIFSFDPSKISCTGAGGVNVTGTFSLLVDNAPFDPLIYPKSVDGNNVEIKHNYKLIFNSSDGTIQNKEVKVGSNITISKRLVAVECLTPVLYYKKDISQQPKIRMTNKVGDDEISVSLNSGNTNAGYYTSGVSLSGNDAKQYHTDYYEGGNKWVSVSYQIVGLEFTGSITPKASPVYGDTWNDIFTLKQTDFTATANGESISGTYRLQLNNAGWHDITGTDIAKYGYNYYRVLFTSDEFGDTVVSTDSLPAPTNGTFLNVAKREVTIEWSNTELIYNGQYQRPIATITNKVGNDDVGVTLNTQAKYVGTYPVSVYELIGADMNNYKLPDPKPSHEFSIAAINQEPLNITPVGDLTYRTDTTISFSTTGGIDGGYVTYSVPENNGVLSISGGNTYIIGAGKVTVTATKIKEGYNNVTATLVIEVNKAAAPAITFPYRISSIIYGQKLSESILEGGSTERGTFAWTNGNIIPTIINSGYEVTFTPNADTIKNYETITNTTSTVPVSVKKATPSVSVEATVSGTLGNRTATLTATVTGIDGGIVPTGTITFKKHTDTTSGSIEGANAVAIVDGKATFEWTGLEEQIYNVNAQYNSDENYNYEQSEKISFDTSKQSQSAIIIGDIGTKTYGDSDFTLSTTGGSGDGEVTFTSTDNSILSISGDTATIHKAGDVTITATKAGDSDYNEVVSSIVLNIGKKTLTVKADDILNIIKGTAMPELTYTVTGLVNGDTFTNPTIISSATDTNAVGEYDITISGGTLDNSDSYNVTYTKGKLTVDNALYLLTVTNGTGDGSYEETATVTITADIAPEGKIFDKWTTTDGVVFTNQTNSTTTFTMPAKAVTVTATYKDAPATPPTTYIATVSNGTGGGSYEETATVTITADTAPEGKIFDKWTTTDGVTFANESASTTTFTMPAKAVTVVANYSKKSGGGGSSSGGSAVIAPEKKIVIKETPTSLKNKELISVKEIGNAFTQSIEIRLKDDSEAKEKVLEALKNKFGSLADSMVIYALDISAFAKGTDTKVQPAKGTSVEITCPIPESLVQHKDSIKVVCIIDGELKVLETKVVKINDVYCIRFVATHFSPYAMVVDTTDDLNSKNDSSTSEKADNPKTSDNALVIISAVAILSIVALGVASKKNGFKLVKKFKDNKIEK